MKNLTRILALVIMAGMSFGTKTLGQAPTERFIRAARPVPGEYIVILDREIPEKRVPEVARDLTRRFHGQLKRVMTSAANGFSVTMSEHLARALSRHPRVLVVEENGLVELASQTPTPHWHLDRIDQPLGTDGYFTSCATGSNVYVYVVDTGVAKRHQEFLTSSNQSRVLPGVSFANDYHPDPDNPSLGDVGTNPCGGFTGNEDVVRTYNAGHGTSVASLIAGKTVGVARNAKIVPVKVGSCPPPNHGPSENIVIETEHQAWGLDWIRSLSNPYRDHRPALVNMSMFVPTSDNLVGAVEHVINGLVLTDYDLQSGRPKWDGIPVIVSANNKDRDACDFSPSRMAWSGNYPTPGHVISVGGTRLFLNGTRLLFDRRWDCRHEESSSSCSGNDPGSNFGNCVDIYAPAHDINSASLKSASSYRERYTARSGTSFSAAIVSGVAAQILEQSPWLSSAQVWYRLDLSSKLLNNSADPHNVNSALPYVGKIPFVQLTSCQ